MEQKIEYKGMTSQPSDYACGDGEMKLAVNAEYRDGGYHAVRVPKEKYKFFGKAEPLFVHQIPEGTFYFVHDGKNLIVYSDEGTKVYEGETTKPTDICNIGKVVIYISDSNLKYLRFADKTYTEISNNFDVAKLKIICDRYEGGVNEDYKKSNELHCNRLNIYTRGKGKKDLDFNYIPYQNRGTVEVMENKLKELEIYKYYEDLLLGKIAELRQSLMKKGYLLFPVLLRYAYRMYDGSNMGLSEPILVYPLRSTIYDDAGIRIKNSDILPSYASYGGSATKVQERNVYFEAYNLCLSICKEEREFLKKNKDLIVGIDIFMSDEIYTIDMSELNMNLHILTTTSSDPKDPASPGVFKDYKWRADSGLKVPDGLKNDFNQIRANPSLKYKSLFDELKKVSSFYLAKTIYTETIISGDGFIRIFEENELSNYKQGVALENYESAKYFHPEGISVFNGRLILYNYIYSKALAGVEDYMIPMIVSPLKTLPDALKEENLYERFDSMCYKMIIDSLAETIAVKSNSNFLPVAHFVQNTITARLWSLNEGGQAKWRMCETKLHDFIDERFMLNVKEFGNYYDYNVSDKYGYIADSIADVEVSRLDNHVTTKHANTIIASETNNPLSFKLSNMVSAGKQTVRAVCMNSMPVSSGQFGQYPLLAFCSDGVFSIGIGTDGTFQSCSPYTYDIIASNGSVGNMERAIVFVTKQGIAIIDGDGRQLMLPADKSSTYAYDKCLPELHQKTFVEKALSGIVKLDNAPQMTDLYTYLTNGARIAYDYPHGRLLVYNPNYNYTYVMEASSGMWSVMAKGFYSNLNVYEQCLMVTKEEVKHEDGTTDDQYKVWNYSTDDVVEGQRAYLITRPFKFGEPDVHKSLQGVIQRGVFCNKNDVKQCLYASNDLYRWVPVHSSDSIYMRGMRGTGYKYFREILFLPEFKQDEVLHGATVEYVPRMTNKMR